MYCIEFYKFNKGEFYNTSPLFLLIDLDNYEDVKSLCKSKYSILEKGEEKEVFSDINMISKNSQSKIILYWSDLSKRIKYHIEVFYTHLQPDNLKIISRQDFLEL